LTNVLEHRTNGPIRETPAGMFYGKGLQGEGPIGGGIISIQQPTPLVWVISGKREERGGGTRHIQRPRRPGGEGGGRRMPQSRAVARRAHWCIAADTQAAERKGWGGRMGGKTGGSSGGKIGGDVKRNGLRRWGGGQEWGTYWIGGHGPKAPGMCCCLVGGGKICCNTGPS
jgi:hypothetical protein